MPRILASSDIVIDQPRGLGRKPIWRIATAYPNPGESISRMPDPDIPPVLPPIPEEMRFKDPDA